MGIIRKLSPHEAQKIAAGEVVERPYNIVKELLENALDAGATQITLFVENGGKHLIRCIDNGCGMSPEDALMSLEHHATSKLTTIDDLTTLTTFGFRGEALSSIASVCTMTLSTQTAHADHGVQLELTYGTLTKQEIIARTPGTDITLEDIFANIPARKKFLKTRETEWRAIYTLVQAIALAHHRVAFTLYHDNNIMITAPATEQITERVAQLFDRTFAEQFLTCDTRDEKNNLSIHGGIAHYQYHRFDKNQQFFFVNKRWIKNYKLGQALFKGFTNVLPPGKFPAGVIFIELPQTDVDINVHPRKEEVVFLHPQLIELHVQRMVQKRLEQIVAQRVMPVFAKAEFILSSAEGPGRPAAPSSLILSLSKGQSEVHAPSPSRYQNDQLFSSPPLVVSAAQQSRIHSSELSHSEINVQPAFEYTIIGQLLKTYILLETPQGLLILDQHAAHESVLYEKFSAYAGNAASLTLLFPEMIQVNQEDQKRLLAFDPQLKQNGITIESMGTNTVAVTQTPLYLKNYNANDLVTDLLTWIHENNALDATCWQDKIAKKFYAMMACKAAVKAGDTMTHLEIEELVASLYKTEHRLTCPHGRPTTWVISQYELEKTFKRKI